MKSRTQTWIPRTIALWLTLLVYAGTGWAQSSQEENTTSSEPEQATPAEGPAASSDSGAPPEETASGSQNSPFDYKSSEEISEDLSVSFPVDI